MALCTYLAMTAAELDRCEKVPPAIGWMACHFSPYGTGLSNLPAALPDGSLLILNDRTPIHGHDPGLITEQLCEAIDKHGCSGVLLDFQRSGSAELEAMTQHLVQALPCPVAVTTYYGKDLSCPIFLPPCPTYRALEQHLEPWHGRSIWLDMALSCTLLELTSTGCTNAAASMPEEELPCQEDSRLHIHYCISQETQKATFLLWRTKADLIALQQQATALGAELFVGLYQELKDLI